MSNVKVYPPAAAPEATRAQVPKECQGSNDKTASSKSGLEQPPMPGIASIQFFFGIRHWDLI
jgi:hypothetical protein